MSEMSKQNEAKEAQGYTLFQSVCGNCKSYTSEMVLPAWMARRNAENVEIGREPEYKLSNHGVEKNMRCGIGGFAVKKNATCSLFSAAVGGGSNAG